MFGMLMRNWDLLRKIPRIRFLFLKEPVEDTTRFLHSITAESSFLIRTFFFVLVWLFHQHTRIVTVAGSNDWEYYCSRAVYYPFSISQVLFKRKCLSGNIFYSAGTNNHFAFL